jgi:hypothetical protein
MVVHIPDVELVTIADAGHLVSLEQLSRRAAADYEP